MAAEQDPNVADKDEEVTDEETGLTYKVVAGEPLPAHIIALRERQEAEKAEKAPAKDKAQKPEANK